MAMTELREVRRLISEASAAVEDYRVTALHRETCTQHKHKAFTGGEALAYAMAPFLITFLGTIDEDTLETLDEGERAALVKALTPIVEIRRKIGRHREMRERYEGRRDRQEGTS